MSFSVYLTVFTCFCMCILHILASVYATVGSALEMRMSTRSERMA